jgi:HEAT repeat protein
MLIVRLSFLITFLSITSIVIAHDEIRPNFEFERDPQIHLPEAVKVDSAKLKPLWLQALARPEADMQRMAADAIGRAHVDGVADMQDAIPGLSGVLAAPASHPAARQAAARALFLLEARAAAPEMALSAEKHGADLRQIVEPALGKWKYEEYRAVWRARLTSREVRHRDLMLAIRCLATLEDRSVVAHLLDLVHDRFRPADVRLDAANAAGLLQEQDLEGDARRLIGTVAQTPLVGRLCAVRLLAHHAGDEAQGLLTQFATDAEPAVRVIALTRLNEIDARLVLPLAEDAMRSGDVKVRQCGADACIKVPDAQRVAAITRLLDDPHPGLRGSVRDSLYELAQRPELNESVRTAATGILTGDQWRGLEQAALLLAALDQKAAVPRLVELLEFSRPEVGIAAAWGLKKLAVPEALPQMLAKAGRQTEIRKKLSPVPAGLDEQTAHLIEAMGRMRYAPAEPLLRQYIPKDYAMGMFSRTAAIWSLGWLHEGIPDESLAAQLAERATDDSSGPGNPPEMRSVRCMSAVSIGRMKATSQVAVFRNYTRGVIRSGELGMSIRWALIQLTGEQIPEPDPPPKLGKAGWFLEPLDN